MPFHIVEQSDSSTTFQEVAGGDGSGEVRVIFANGADISFGRGQSSTLQTYIKLNSPDGTDSYIVASNADAVTASGTRP